MSLRDKFAERFGEKEAEKIVMAALEHDSERMIEHDSHSDFRWAMLIVIGWQCVEKFADYHKINITYEDFKQFVIENRDEFLNYEGDYDYIGLIAGAYNFILEGE